VVMVFYEDGERDSLQKVECLVVVFHRYSVAFSNLLFSAILDYIRRRGPWYRNVMASSVAMFVEKRIKVSVLILLECYLMKLSDQLRMEGSL